MRKAIMGDVLIAGEVVLYGDVGDAWGEGFDAKDVANALAQFDANDRLMVRINSGGGSVWEGVAIYNMLRRRGNVTVYIDSIAARAASVIAMAGDDIIIGPGAMIMIHEPMSDTFGGNAGEHQKNAETLDQLAATVAAIYAERTGISAEQAREMMQAETWMGPDDAIANGFATRLDEPTTEGKASMSKIKADAKATIAQARMEDKEEDEEMAAAGAPVMEEDGDKDEEMSASTVMEDDEDEEMSMEEDEDEEMRMEEDEDEEMSAVRAAARKAVAVTDYRKQYRNAPASVRGQRAAKRGKGPAMKDATLQIFNKCSAVGLSMAQTNEVIARSGGSLAKAKNIIIDTLADKDSGSARAPASVKADARDKFVEGATKGITARVGMAGGERNEFSGMTLKEVAQESLRMAGVNTRFTDPMLMVGAAMQPARAGVSIAPRMSGAGMASTSDFAEILSNVANKSMLIGYEEAGETFEQWTATGSLPDFKQATRLDLGLFPSLTEVPEGAEYKYAKLSERKANIQLATFGKMFAITRQSIINDDLSVFSRIPARMGRAAKRTVANLVYAILNDNPLLPDGVALFHATHANLAASGGAPTVTTLDAARTSMALQTDVDGHADSGLNLRPSFFLVPVELEGTAKVLMAAQYDPDTADKLQKPNMVAGLATVISDARLSAASATAWYLATSPSATDTIEVAYLNGVSTPTMEERPGWNVDGLEYKIRLDAGVQVLDHRGLYKNAGA